MFIKEIGLEFSFLEVSLPGCGISVISAFIYGSGKDSLPPVFGTHCAPPSFPHVFIVLIAYYSVSLFSPGGGRSVQVLC
jgi:hypothetical protein